MVYIHLYNILMFYCLGAVTGHGCLALATRGVVLPAVVRFRESWRRLSESQFDSLGFTALCTRTLVILLFFPIICIRACRYIFLVLNQYP